MSTAATNPPLPEEVTSTISRLSAYKNVHGVLILSRSGGLIRAEGPAFENDDDDDEDVDADGEDTETKAGVSEEVNPGKEAQGSKYARVVAGIVDAVRSGLEEIDDSGELKLLRIRTKKHELIITPGTYFFLLSPPRPSQSKWQYAEPPLGWIWLDDKYLLVVLQDPS
ncbi:hypothetical protein QFC22_001683 [Naganishia vaughanmartiniae]|uniref:Uncharacterized protein n=1 Tax=Naganishia vaughanmartiniae TaxID=1424756 RepID=A0ACC2XEL1_9TREE|nr:hypothetical protein QFC22_001683 [Naganishia vaughanmartiniae]